MSRRFPPSALPPQVWVDIDLTDLDTDARLAEPDAATRARVLAGIPETEPTVEIPPFEAWRLRSAAKGDAA